MSVQCLKAHQQHPSNNESLYIGGQDTNEQLFVGLSGSPDLVDCILQSITLLIAHTWQSLVAMHWDSRCVGGLRLVLVLNFNCCDVGGYPLFVMKEVGCGDQELAPGVAVL